MKMQQARPAAIKRDAHFSCKTALNNISKRENKRNNDNAQCPH
jgi:hypothetical protein